MTEEITSSWLVPGWQVPDRVRALSTTRQGGRSTGPWASFNLGGKSGDDPTHVAANRELLQRQLPQSPAWLRQVHGRELAYLDGGILPDRKADGAWTDQPGVVCAILHADCLPLLLCRDDGGAVAALHGGWRGLAQDIISHSLAALPGAAGEWMAWLGPAIGPNAFEVGPEVRKAFIERDPELAQAFTPCRPGHWLADLYAIARHDLAQAGVTRVSGGEYCTYTDERRFFSHRREAPSGRMASLIWLDK